MLISIVYYFRNEIKNAVLIFVITILITTALFGSFLFLIDDYPNSLVYELKIETDTDGDYVLYVPYLQNEGLEAQMKMNMVDLDIEFIDIVDIPVNGSNRALKVEYWGDITIHSETLDNGNYTFTMTKERYRTHWVWCNKTNSNQNISIQIYAHVSHNGGGNTWMTPNSVLINEGWNEIEIEYLWEE